MAWEVVTAEVAEEVVAVAVAAVAATVAEAATAAAILVGRTAVEATQVVAIPAAAGINDGAPLNAKPLLQAEPTMAAPGNAAAQLLRNKSQGRHLMRSLTFHLLLASALMSLSGCLPTILAEEPPPPKQVRVQRAAPVKKAAPQPKTVPQKPVKPVPTTHTPSEGNDGGGGGGWN